MSISSTPTANLMTAFEPILVELVNPTPGYQPGTGKEDGAQIVQGANGCEWWAPELGCDSLDATLEAIRYRISRYLREPVAGVETATAPTPPAGEVEELAQWLDREADYELVTYDSSRFRRAATLLRQLEQVAYAASDYLCGTRFPEFANEHGGIDSLKTNLSRLVAHFEHGPRPVPGVDVPGPDGDFGGIEELCNAEGVDVRIGAPLLRRARNAWLPANALPLPTPTPAGEEGANA